ncbi:hypothetical protein [Alkalicoccus luteus]|uniref:Uncharacterized protein n=1 Tax=Alkalicoccus luteus TaxID=1237094 RepID=A0A969PT23_9BACI|nr:hypothetical protein [Alkalicoccus luteus]NJP37024.1 hypothetical protein [Alkalicoccus luteus]
MFELTNHFPHDLFYDARAPFLSLYQATERAGREKQSNAVVFRNMLKDLDRKLREGYPHVKADELVKPLRAIAEDRHFWRTIPESIAVFAAEGRCVVYQLERPVKSMSIVSERPFISPLIRVFQSADDYQLLGLTKDTFRLYQGNRYGLKEITLPEDIPKTKEEVVGDEKKESHLDQVSLSGGNAAYFGQGGRKDEMDKDTEKFFRYVDRYVTDHHSHKTRLPLMLVSVNEHHGLYHKVSSNAYLMEEGIKSDINSLELGELTKRAWNIVEPVYLEKTKKAVDAFETARAHGKGSSHLEEIALALTENRLARLLIEDGRHVAGHIDELTGEVSGARTEERQAGDILGDLTELAFRRHIALIVLPKERMPVTTGAAGIFR